MAPLPPNLGSQSEDSSDQLDYIEQALQKIRQSTLKIKKRNDEIIKSIDRRNPNVSVNSVPPLKSGWIGSPVDVPGVTARAPQKPPRHMQSSQLTMEVQRALRESSEVKKKMQDTLRACAESRKQHQKYVEALKEESLALTTPLLPPPAPIAHSTLNHTSGFISGLRGVFKKFSYISSDSIPARNIDTQPRNSKINEIQNNSNSKVECSVAVDKITEPNAVSLQSELVLPIDSTCTPKAKPRTIRPKPGSESNVDGGSRPLRQPLLRPQRPPPSPPSLSDKTSVTLAELQNLYDNATPTDDESTLPRPPVPKPRTKLRQANHNPVTTPLIPGGSECDDSSSDFEFVGTPLNVKTVAISDSDDSLLAQSLDATRLEVEEIQNSKGYLKKSTKSPHVPRQYRKPSAEQYQNKIENPHILKDIPRKPAQKGKRKPRPSSPPPPPVFSVKIQPQESQLSNLSEEEVFPPMTMNETVPVLSELSEPIVKAVVYRESECAGSGISALCPGVPINCIKIPVKPWVQKETPTQYKISNSPFNSQSSPANDNTEIKISDPSDIKLNNNNREDPSTSTDTEYNSEQTPDPIFGDFETRSIQQEIYNDFAFLDNEPEVELRVDKSLEDEKQNSFFGVEEPHKEVAKSCLYNKMETIIFESFSSIEDIKSDQRIYPSTESVEEFSEFSEGRVENMETIDYPVTNCAPIDSGFSSLQICPPDLPQTAPPPSIQIPIAAEDVQLPWGSQESVPTKQNHNPTLPSQTDAEKAPQLPQPPAMPSIPIFSNLFRIKKSNLPLAPLDESKYDATIFKRLEGQDDANQLEFDIGFIQENFMRQDSPENDRKFSTKNNNADPTTTTLSLLSPKWTKAVEIGSKILNSNRKDSKFDEEIIPALEGLNINGMNSDEVQILLQIIPKDNEESLLKSLSEETLRKEFKLMKSLSGIPRLSKKLEAINYLLNFDETANALDADLTTLETATSSIQESTNFPIILRTVLLIINKAFVKDAEPVKGFEIQSLHRLADKKSVDGKMSLLQCIVKCIEETTPKSLKFYQDFASIDESSKLSITELRKRIDTIEAELNETKLETTTTKEETKDEKALESLAKTSETIDANGRKLKVSKERWEAVLENLKKLTAYFGVNQNVDPIELFITVRNFVNDYKHAVVENEKLSRSTSTLESPQKSAAVGGVQMRRPRPSPPPQPHSQNEMAQNRRFSSGGLRELQDLHESGESPELIAAIKSNVLGSGRGEKENRQARRNGAKLRSASRSFLLENNRERE